MKQKKKINDKPTNTKLCFRIIKFLLLLCVASVLVIATIKFFPFFKNIGTESGRNALYNKIEQMGILGPVFMIFLVMVQLFLAIIPGEPLEILAGICFGTIGGILIIFIGVFLASTIIFFSTRKFGTSFIETFFGAKKLEKMQNHKLFSNPKRLNFILFLLFFIPGTPKDLFVYLGALLPVNPLKFLLIATFARFPSVITSTYCGANLIKGDLKKSIIIFVFTFLLSMIGIALYHFFEKKANQKLSKRPN